MSPLVGHHYRRTHAVILQTDGTKPEDFTVPATITHEFWNTYDVVYCVAQALYDVMLGTGGTYTDLPRALTDLCGFKGAKSALRSFRLINHVCALAGQRPLFREIILGSHYRTKPTNTLLRYLEHLAKLPQAGFVRSIDLSRQEGWVDHSGPAILLHMNNSRSPEDKLPLELRIAEHWLIETLGSFSNLRRVVVLAPDGILDIIAKIDIPLRELDLRPNEPLSSIRPSTGTFAGISADTNALFEQLKCMSIHDLSAYVSGSRRSKQGSQAEFVRQMISSYLCNARNLECLMLSPWYPGSRSSIGAPDPPLSILTNLRVLQLYGIPIHSSTLCDVLKSNAMQLRSIELSGISLRSGYWEHVLDQIGAIILTLTHLRLQWLEYDLPRTERAAIRLSARMQFGPLRTLRSADRAAWTRVLSTPSSVLCWERAQYITNRSLPLLNKAHARCAATAQTPNTDLVCRAISLLVRDLSGIWVHKADNSPLERVWLCRSHVDQRNDFDNWPWGRSTF